MDAPPLRPHEANEPPAGEGPSVAPVPEIEMEPRPRGFLPGVLRFFVVPLGLVAASVGIFAGLGALVGQGLPSNEDLVRAILDGGKNSRWQAAMELSNRVVAEPAVVRDERLVASVSEAFSRARRDGDDARILGYLSRFLAASRSPGGRAVLEEALADGNPDVRVYVARALGEMADPGAVAALLPRLKDTDAGVRTIAAWAVAAAAEGSAAEAAAARPALLAALEDSCVDVQWNAALGLARLGFPGGEDLHWRMLHRDYVRAQLREAPGGGLEAFVRGAGSDPITREQREGEVVRNALSAVYRTGDRSALDGVRRLAAEDPDLGVREFALAAAASLEREVAAKGTVPQRAWQPATAIAKSREE